MNTEQIINITEQLKERIEDNPFNYDINLATYNLLLRELGARGRKVRELKERIAVLKDLYYKTIQTFDEQVETYAEIKELSRKLLEM